MAAAVKPLPIGDVIRDLRSKMEDAALDGNYAASEKIAEEVEKYEELQSLGELFVVNF